MHLGLHARSQNATMKICLLDFMLLATVEQSIVYSHALYSTKDCRVLYAYLFLAGSFGLDFRLVQYCLNLIQLLETLPFGSKLNVVIIHLESAAGEVCLEPRMLNDILDGVSVVRLCNENLAEQVLQHPDTCAML
jgi:hypothetical protein